jgi:hypothetical protein
MSTRVTQEQLSEEIDRLLFMIEYAIDAPDMDSMETVLMHAWNGIGGADDLEAIKEAKG